MKLTVFMLFLALLHVSAKGVAQKISISEKNVSLEKLFKEIHAQTGYQFFYTGKLLSSSKPVSIHISNADLSVVLDLCFKDQPLSYVMDAQSVIVKEKTLTDRVIDLFNFPVEISGKVTDSLGNTLPGVSVKIKGKPVVAITNSNGWFTIKAEKGDIAEFSFIGFTKAQYKITEAASNIAIVLHSATNSLSETVIIGYGSTTKKDLTGSVSTIDAAQVHDVPFTTIDNAMAGKAAGVQVTKSDGSPGGAVKIRIRGSSSLLGGNDPLYIIDGVPVQVQSSFINPGYNTGNPAGSDINSGGSSGSALSSSSVNGLNTLNGLNPEDIESISILKDASSTAIYGSKAANGVVIITTKRGSFNMKPQVTANYYTTVSSPITEKVLDASQYKSLLTASAQNSFNYRAAAGSTQDATVNSIINSPGTFFGTANTNWIDLVTRNTVSQNADVAVQGGSAGSKYYSSIGYNNSPGVVIGTDYKRISGKINLENTINSHFSFLTNIDLAYTEQNLSDGTYAQALRARPDYSPYDANGNFTNFSAQGAAYQGFQNPLALSTAVNNSRTFNLLGSTAAILHISKALEFKSMVSLNMQSYNQRNYNPSYLSVSSYSGNADAGNGIGSNSNSQLANWFVENTLTYHKKLDDKNELNLLAGTSYETRKYSYFTATGTGYPNDQTLTSLSSATTPLLVSGDNPTSPQSYLLSFYLRANYTYMDKYLLTFTGRTDGSSKFGPDNKFGYFPSGAIGYRLSQERFLKQVSWLDDLKLRASYGVTGTQNIGDQMYRTLYTPASYAGVSALLPTQVGNSALKWETTKQADAGIDFTLFNNRLSGTLDYYHKRTNGVLLNIPVAPSTSYSSVLNNVADITNKGFEVALNGDLVRARDFKWNMSFNISWNRSMVNNLLGADVGQIGSLTGLETAGNTAIIEGKPLGLIIGRKITGIIQNQQQLNAYKAALGPIYAGIIYKFLAIGDPMYALAAPNAYGRPISNNEIIGNGEAKFYGGFTEGFSYKNFDLTAYFTYSYGGKLMWADDVSSVEFTGTSNANVSMLDYWSPTNTSSARPRLIDEPLATTGSTNLSVYNSSYIKLRTLTLNYRFNKDIPWIKKAGLHNLAVFASATNLFTITKYPGTNPETTNDSYSVAGGYFDVSNYPPVRTVSLGVKLGF